MGPLFIPWLMQAKDGDRADQGAIGTTIAGGATRPA
jgi:hypothetical protein